MNPQTPGELRIVDLETLYDAFHGQAIGLAYRLLRDRDEAEEVVQEAFLSAWRNGTSYDAEKGSARTWFLTLVRHRSIDLLRARQRRPMDRLDESFDFADSADAASEALARVEGQAAREALATLPAEQRVAVELAYFQGLAHSEIAERLNLPLGTVKGRVRGALDRLRVAPGFQAAPEAVPQLAVELDAPILIVDDDPAVRRFIGRALEDEGLRVIVASDGAEALDRARRQPPRLVVLDLLMPRMDGDTLAAALRSASAAHLPILMMSVDRSLPEKAAQVGAYAYLEKPFELDELLASVRVGLVGQTAEASLTPA